MPLVDYDYSYSGNLAEKPRRKAIFDQEVAEAWLRKPSQREIIEDRYEEDFRMVEERLNKIRRKSFDYEMEAKSGKKVSYKNKPEAIQLDDEEIGEEERIKEEKKQERKQKREVALRRLSNVSLFILFAVIALFICYRYSIINEKFNKVEKLKKELANSQTVNEQLQADIDGETDISYIENFAKYQLGMQKPQASQMVYINMDKKDKVFTPVKIEEETEEVTWVDELVEKIANIFE